MIDPTPDPPGRRTKAVIGFTVGIILLLIAIWAVWTRREDLSDAFVAVSRPRWWLIALALTLPLVNVVATGALFWMLTRRYGRVGFAEMNALIASAWLMNYLPLRAGLLGRVAYHKTVNDIRVQDSARVLAWQSVASACSLIFLLAGAWAVSHPTLLAFASVAAASVLIAAVVWFAPRWSPHAPTSAQMLAAVLLRLIDVAAWTARYTVAFALIGTPIGLVPAAFFALVSQLALLIAITGNGLGLREWCIAIAAAWVVTPSAADPAALQALGLAADLVNRAAEVLIAIPSGAISTAWLTRRLAKRPRENAQ